MNTSVEILKLFLEIWSLSKSKYIDQAARSAYPISLASIWILALFTRWVDGHVSEDAMFLNIDALVIGYSHNNKFYNFTSSCSGISKYFYKAVSFSR